MDLESSLRLERYKLVTSRQAWVVDVARSVFSSYATTLAAFVGGTLTLTYATDAVKRLGSPAVSTLLLTVAIFNTCAALASVYQIYFCLKRWHEFRNAECKIYHEAPKPEGWAKNFELAFIVMISASVALVWVGYFALSGVVATITAHCRP